MNRSVFRHLLATLPGKRLRPPPMSLSRSNTGLKPINDGIVRPNPLPHDMWGSWTPHNPTRQWIEYTWSRPVILNALRLVFWADHPAGANEGVAPPKSWHLEYWTEGGWRPVQPKGAYPAAADGDVSVKFAPVTTRCLRAVLEASGDAQGYAGLAVQEWEALTPQAVRLAQPGVKACGLATNCPAPQRCR